MKRILVPYDFSETADHALNQAEYIAGKTGAQLRIYHVAPLHPYWAELSQSDRTTYMENLKLAHGIEKRLEEKKRALEGRGIDVVTKFTPGPVIENIVKYSQEYEIDLLVMGTHGMSGIKEWMIGSNTQKILRQVTCPVLSVKHDLVYRDFKKIAFLSSLHWDNDAPFETMLNFASIFNSDIVLINMDEPGFFRDPLLVIHKAMREYQDIAKSRGFNCSMVRLANENLEAGLKKHIQENDIDLVVVPTHGKGALARIFSSSIAETVVNHLEKPVMTIRI